MNKVENIEYRGYNWHYSLENFGKNIHFKWMNPLTSINWVIVVHQDIPVGELDELIERKMDEMREEIDKTKGGKKDAKWCI